MTEPDEVLDHGRPVTPRRRLIVVPMIVLLAGAAAFVVADQWPRSASNTAARSSAPPRTAPPAGTTPSAPTRPPQPWPTAPGACNSEQELPLVESGPFTRVPGLQVVVGGSELSVFDFDGDAVSTPEFALRRGEYVVQLAAADRTYALTGRCNGPDERNRLFRLDARGHATPVDLPRAVWSIYPDGERLWGVEGQPDERGPATLVPLADKDGARLRLPAGFFPVGVTSGRVAGWLDREVALVDVASGQLVERLGEGSILAVGHTSLVWATGCEIDANAPCALQRRDFTTGATGSFPIPRSVGFAAGVLSPDGDRAAFTLQRAAADPRYEPGHPLPPADVAVLDFPTNELHIVPGIELTAKTAPGLTFSRDGRWLAIALAAGTRTRVLAWRLGLAEPIEQTPIRGFGWSPAPIATI